MITLGFNYLGTPPSLRFHTPSKLDRCSFHHQPNHSSALAIPGEAPLDSMRIFYCPHQRLALGFVKYPYIASRGMSMPRNPHQHLLQHRFGSWSGDDGE